MDYDQQVEQIREENALLLTAFQKWLENSRLSAKTVRNHVENVDFFTEYQKYYEPLEPLIEADAGDFLNFCASWFPRKAMWASPGNARSNIASFRKFAKFITEVGHWSAEHAQEISQMLKENRDEIIESAEW